MPSLRAIGWDHERCMAPMRAASRIWADRSPGVQIDWEARSLTAFGDEPLEEIADRYDLLVIDHPFVGRATEARCLRPLDELLEPGVLAALAADAVGASHASYTYAGRQWAIAIDAACQVAAVRDDLIEGRPVPATWTEVLALARELPGRLAVPLHPAHAISSLCTLCANAGRPPAQDGRLLDPETGVRALEILVELALLGHPESLAFEPPDALDRMTSTDEIVYVPLVYGYVSYSPTCRFLDLPSSGRGPVGAILGGAGLAVSAASREPELAAAFAAWVGGKEAQVEVVAPAGGQPGSRSAWIDPALDRAAGGFFSGTIATIDAAWMRPREPWWPPFQLAAGRLLRRALGTAQRPREILAELEHCYLACRERSAA